MTAFRALLCLLLSSVAYGSTEYYRHVVFDNSLTPDAYFNSLGSSNGGSFLELEGDRIPVETKFFLTPPNALRLQWQSRPGGGWEAEIHLDFYRNRFPEMHGQNLFFWCFSSDGIASDDLPSVLLSNTSQGLHVAEFPGAFTEPLSLGKFARDIPKGKWIRVRIPLSAFHTSSIYEFRPEDLRSVVFHQGRADGARHTLIVDEVRMDDDPPAGETRLPPPANLRRGLPSFRNSGGSDVSPRGCHR